MHTIEDDDPIEDADLSNPLRESTTQSQSQPSKALSFALKSRPPVKHKPHPSPYPKYLISDISESGPSSSTSHPTQIIETRDNYEVRNGNSCQAPFTSLEDGSHKENITAMQSTEEVVPQSSAGPSVPEGSLHLTSSSPSRYPRQNPARRGENSRPASSDESFAYHPTTQDVNAYMTTTRAFHIPLNDLGRSHRNTQPIDNDGIKTEEKSDHGSGDEGLHKMPPLNQYRSHLTPGARVLASATPSAAFSQGSQESIPFSQRPYEIEPTQILETSQSSSNYLQPTQILPSSSEQVAQKVDHPGLSVPIDPKKAKPAPLITPHIEARYRRKGFYTSAGRIEIRGASEPLAPTDLPLPPEKRPQSSSRNPSPSPAAKQLMPSSPEIPLACSDDSALQHNVQSNNGSTRSGNLFQSGSPPESREELKKKKAVPPSESDATLGMTHAVDGPSPAVVSIEESAIPKIASSACKRAHSEDSPHRVARRKVGDGVKAMRGNEPEDQAPVVDTRNNKVFALWSGNYYSGKVMGISAQKFVVRFDDGDSSTVELSKMRKCELYAGDQVQAYKFKSRPNTGIVKSFDLSEDQVSVEFGSGGLARKMAISELRIKSAWVNSNWGDRKLSAGDIAIPDEWEPSVKRSPTKAPRSTTFVTNTASSSVTTLGETAFIISLSTGDSDTKTQQKNELTEEMQRNGVTILSDWTSLYTLDGEFSDNEKCWIGNLCDIHFQGGSVKRVALLGEKETSKPRYLFALACGFPCLDISFWKNFKDNGPENWRNYLLPAGYSEKMKMAVTQSCNYFWHCANNHLSDFAKFGSQWSSFTGKTVIFIGERFVPFPSTGPRTNKGKERANGAREASSYLPKIVLALGAKQVEAVTTLKLASSPMKSYDFAVLPDDEKPGRELLQYSNIKCIDVHWLKEHLFSHLSD